MWTSFTLRWLFLVFEALLWGIHDIQTEEVFLLTLARL